MPLIRITLEKQDRLNRITLEKQGRLNHQFKQPAIHPVPDCQEKLRQRPQRLESENRELRSRLAKWKRKMPWWRAYGHEVSNPWPNGWLSMLRPIRPGKRLF